ncbi:25056_t:CDS:2, partial [Gigaspora rosea]
KVLEFFDTLEADLNGNPEWSKWFDSSNVSKDTSDSQLENAALFFTQNLDTRTSTRYSGVPGERERDETIREHKNEEVESESSDTVKGNGSDSWTLSSPIPSNLSTSELTTYDPGKSGRGFNNPELKKVIDNQEDQIRRLRETNNLQTEQMKTILPTIEKFRNERNVKEYD